MLQPETAPKTRRFGWVVAAAEPHYNDRYILAPNRNLSSRQIAK